MPWSARQPCRELEGARRGARVKVGLDGRILVPADLRRAAGIEPGKPVNLRVEDGRLVVEDPMVALRRLQDMLAPLKSPGVSIVDEFLAERRAMWGED